MATKSKKWVQKKIRHLIKNEGKTPKQAAGQAYAMAGRKRRKKGAK